MRGQHRRRGPDDLLARAGLVTVVGVGALAVVALLPIGLFTLWFGRASLRLNAALNDRLEREVALVARGSYAGVRRHFAHRLRFWRVRISDAEATVWGGIEVVHTGLTLAALALLARESDRARRRRPR